MVGALSNCNIIQFTNKTATSDDFVDIYKVVLDDISDNMKSLVYSGKYGSINTSDPTTMGYYMMKYVLDAFTLQ